MVGAHARVLITCSLVARIICGRPVCGPDGPACRCDLKRIQGHEVNATFLDALREPLIIEGLMNGWPAYGRWTKLEFINRYDAKPLGMLASEYASDETHLYMRNVTRDLDRPNICLIFGDYPHNFLENMSTCLPPRAPASLASATRVGPS